MACFGGGVAAFVVPAAYIPLGSASEVIAVNVANNKITRRYAGVENPHGLVATPDGEYLVAGSLKEAPIPVGVPADAPNSKLYANATQCRKGHDGLLTLLQRMQ